jgi:hypothetical protein
MNGPRLTTEIADTLMPGKDLLGISPIFAKKVCM